MAYYIFRKKTGRHQLELRYSTGDQKLKCLQGQGDNAREERSEFLPFRILCPVVFRSPGFSKKSQN